MLITSIDNERIKKYIKLKDRKYRDQENMFLVEGIHLVTEAYKKGIIEEIILEENEINPFDVPVIYVTREILKKITTVETPQNIMALCKKIISKKEYGTKVLLLDRIQDPGNLGTIIRSAKAFNIDTIILGEETVDIYNPKVIRSTQGILFHINIIKRNLIEVVEELKQHQIPIYGTNVGSGKDIREIKSLDKYALIMGNEGQGVNEELLKLCDEHIYIKLNNNVESLNVSVATTILLYELNRRD